MLEISEDLVVYKDEEKDRMKQLVNRTSKERLLNLITDLSTLQNNMKWASDREVIFEAGLIKIALQGETSNNKTITKIESNNTFSQEVEKPKQTNTLKEKVLAALKENHKMIMHTILSNAEFKQVDDELVHIEFSKAIDDVNKQYMQKEDSKIIIKETVKNALNKEMKIKYVF